MSFVKNPFTQPDEAYVDEVSGQIAEVLITRSTVIARIHSSRVPYIQLRMNRYGIKVVAKHHGNSVWTLMCSKD